MSLHFIGVAAPPPDTSYGRLLRCSLCLLLALATPVRCNREEFYSSPGQGTDPLTIVGAISAVGSLFSAYKLNLGREETENAASKAQEMVSALTTLKTTECEFLADVDCSLKKQRETLAQDSDDDKLTWFCKTTNIRKRLKAFFEEEMRKNDGRLYENREGFRRHAPQPDLIQQLCSEAQNPAFRRQQIWKLDVQRLRLDTLLESQCGAARQHVYRKCDKVDVEGMMPSSHSKASALSEIRKSAFVQGPGLDVILGIVFTAMGYASTTYDVYDSFATQGSACSSLNDMAEKQLESVRMSMCSKLKSLFTQKAQDTAWTAALLRHSAGDSEDGGFTGTFEWPLPKGSQWFCDPQAHCLKQEADETFNQYPNMCLSMDSLRGEDRVKVCGQQLYGQGPPFHEASLPKACFQSIFGTPKGKNFRAWIVTFEPGSNNNGAEWKYDKHRCMTPINDYEQSSSQLESVAKKFKELTCKP